MRDPGEVGAARWGPAVGGTDGAEAAGTDEILGHDGVDDDLILTQAWVMEHIPPEICSASDAVVRRRVCEEMEHGHNWAEILQWILLHRRHG